MALTDFRTLTFENDIKGQDLDRLQDSIKAYINQFKDNLTIDGTLLKDVTLAVGSNDVQNPLQRPVNGFYVTKQNAAGLVWGNTFTAQTLTIHASAAVVVDMWVF